jgi:hypothetical protein
LQHASTFLFQNAIKEQNIDLKEIDRKILGTEDEKKKPQQQEKK